MKIASYGLLTPALHADPAPILARARHEAPVHFDPTLGTWVLSRWAEVSSVLKDPAYSADRGGAIAGLGTPELEAKLAWCSDIVLRWMVYVDPPRHTRLRAAVHRHFNSAAMAALRPAIARAVDEAMAGPRRRGRLEVMSELAVPLPARITTELLGLPLSDSEMLKTWTTDMFSLFGAGVADAPIIERAYASLRACNDYFATRLEERRRRPGDDLISALATARDLDEDDRIGLCATLVAGGYETTTHVAGNGLWALLRFPEQLARVRADPKLIGNAVEEIIRWDGPAFSVVRRAIVEQQLNGATIKPGDKLYCLLYSANRDPARFSEPDVFDVTRADTQHLGFGHGIHFCLGAALSRIESAAMLGALIALPNLALDRDALGGGTPTYVANLAARGLQALPICFDPG
jgi:cytochrome P450